MNFALRALLALIATTIVSPAVADRAITLDQMTRIDAFHNVQHEHIRAFQSMSDDQRRAGSGSSTLGGAPVTVGPAPECDYSDLQVAINDGMTGTHDGDILVHIDYTRNSEYIFGAFAGWQSNFRIFGGYDSCVPEQAQVVGRTVLDANGSGRLIDITRTGDESDPLRTVEIRNFELTGGAGESFGGGIRVRGTGGRLAVELSNVEVRENLASLGGGGVFLQALNDSVIDFPGQVVPPLLFLDDDSHVLGNESASVGGGIFCSATQTSNPEMIHLRTGGGLILANEAIDGGGVALTRCFAVLRNGGPTALLLFPSGGIIGNTASGRGGGLIASNGAVVTLSGSADSEFGGDPISAALVQGNSARQGGGLYMMGEGTRVNVLEAVITGNSAEFDSAAPDPGATGRGGGVFVTDGANFNVPLVEGLTSRCAPPSSQDGLSIEPPCNRIRNNTADRQGGGLFVYNGALASLSNTYIEGNSAGALSNGSAMMASNDSDFVGTDRARIVMINSLISQHVQGSRVVYAFSGGEITVAWSTLADNSYPANGALLRAFAETGEASRIDLIGSVAWPDPHAGGTMLTRGGDGQTQVFVDCVIGFDDVSELEADGTIFYSQIDPEFADPVESDYRPGLTSPAIDYCSDEQGPPTVDLDVAPRGLPYQVGSTTPAPNPEPGGTYDLGAWAGSRGDQIFRDRFSQ